MIITPTIAFHLTENDWQKCNEQDRKKIKFRPVEKPKRKRRKRKAA